MPAAPDSIAASLGKSRRVRRIFVFLTARLETGEVSVYGIVEPLESGGVGEVSHALKRVFRENLAVLPFYKFDQPRLNLRCPHLARRAQRQCPQPVTMESNQAYLERDLVARERAAATAILVPPQYLHPNPGPRRRSRGGRTAD